MLLRPRDDGGERAVEALEDQRAGVADLKRERRVDDVRGGEAVVEPAAFRAELLGDGVDERGEVVVQSSPRSRATRAGEGAVARRRGSSRTASAGTTPTSAQPSSAASSTSSQRASLPSSDQILAMAGRE